MVDAVGKENIAPVTSSDPLALKANSPSPKTTGRKGRSKSIGPGGLDGSHGAKEDFKEMKNRRKSAFVPAVKSILPTKEEETKRKDARRKSLANRRVSFAPEATLHTWDVVEYMRDQTTSSASSESTRRASNITRSYDGGSSFKQPSSDPAESPSTPPEQVDEPTAIPHSPAPAREVHQKKRRRSSGIPPMNFNNPEEDDSVSGSSDKSGSEDDSEGESSSEDDEGTALSLDAGEETVQSAGTDSSTGSSARLEAALSQAAHHAGTPGIEYDEYGEMSMELAGEGVTNTFKPWAQKTADGTDDSPSNDLAAMKDQENINPFSPAFKAQLVSGLATRPETIEEEDEDMSMDMTKVVGGIKCSQRRQSASSVMDDDTMDLTQAIGKIHQTGMTGQKRRRSTTEAGSPAGSVKGTHSKRRRSSVARTSMGDDTMDLTVAVGSIQQTTSSPIKTDRRKSVARRRSSGVESEQDETMDFTQALGSIKPIANATKHNEGDESFDTNEELTMELTTVLGGIKATEKAAAAAAPVTLQIPGSSLRSSVNATPKDQDRFEDVTDSGPKMLLTPVFLKQAHVSPKRNSARKSKSPSSTRRVGPSIVSAEYEREVRPSPTNSLVFSADIPKSPSPVKIVYPELPFAGPSPAPFKGGLSKSPARRQSIATLTNNTLAERDVNEVQASPTAQKALRSTPAKAASTPEKQSPATYNPKLSESIKLLSTPRKETGATPLKRLKNLTPKKQPTPRKLTTPRAQAAPKRIGDANGSPVRQLSNDLLQVKQNGKPVEKMHLYEFLEMAGIRFMDITTTKRRLTVVPTPSKLRATDDFQDAAGEDAEITLESALLAGASTVPMLDMYTHACHELKRYTSEGKSVIKTVESSAYKDTPPLIRAYMAAAPDRKAAIDAQLRDIKTHARLRSKEMWYAWRTQLLEGLMDGLRGIGEGLIADDEVLRRDEEILQQTLPTLIEQQECLQAEAERLEEAAASTTEFEKAALEEARARLTTVGAEMEEKRQMLTVLQREVARQDEFAENIEESKIECLAAILEADRVREACRGWSVKEVTALKDSVKQLETEYGWAIASASTSSSTLTMTYKGQLELFFHPRAFDTARSRSNAPISLTYTAGKPITTILRFFLQLLRACLHALPQCTTRVPELLRLVSSGWDTALSVSAAERRLSIDGITESSILSDERLAITSTLLLPKVRTKVQASFEIAASVRDGLELSARCQPSAQTVYGEKYNDKKMTNFLASRCADGIEGWDGAVGELRERLIARGPKNKGKGRAL